MRASLNHTSTSDPHLLFLSVSPIMLCLSRCTRVVQRSQVNGFSLSSGVDWCSFRYGTQQYAFEEQY